MKQNNLYEALTTLLPNLPKAEVVRRVTIEIEQDGSNSFIVEYYADLPVSGEATVKGFIVVNDDCQ